MYLVFTPLFYINGKPHVGHLYTLYVAKMFGRYLSASGKSYITITGTDEHGEKVYHSYLDYATKNNKHDLTLDDYRYLRREDFNRVFEVLDSCMIYNSHSELHKSYVAHIFNDFLSRGLIYEGKYSGYYNLREEKYIDDAEYDSLSKEEIEKFVVLKEEQGYYFRLEESVKDIIIDNIETNIVNSDFIEYSKNLVRDAKDIFITRECKSYDSKIEHSVYLPDLNIYVYVWFSSILYYCAILRVYNYKLFTPILIIGKDIQMFHCSLLMHISYHLFGYLPFKIVTHSMLNINKVKVSKSYDNFDTLNSLIEEFSDLFYSYLLTKNFSNDIEISREGLLQYANQLKCDIHNAYKRYLSLLPSYKASVNDWYVLANQLIEHEDHIELVKLFCEVYLLKEYLTGAKIYDILIKVASYINKKITEKEFWVYSSEKELSFFIVGNYARFMLILQSILCTPGIEDICIALKENITSSLSLATKMIEIKMNELNILDLNYNASTEFRKRNKEKEQSK